MIYKLGWYAMYRKHNVVCHYCKSHATFHVRDWTYDNLAISSLRLVVLVTQQLERFYFRYRVLCHFNSSIRSKYILQRCN